ncbi:HEMGN protein, partial [Penelope pileata]|nr:HEMGN protein [Penelope pileata]
GVTTSRCLRDREMLRKRKAEAEEKDSMQWALGEHERSKRQRRGQGARRGKGKERVVEPTPEPKLQLEPQPLEQEEANLASPLVMQQAESPLEDIQDLFGGVQLGDLEGILASGSQSPLGEEDMLRLADEISEETSTPLEKTESDDNLQSTNLF